MPSTEKALKEFEAYIKELGDQVTEENFQEYSQRFIQDYNEKMHLKKAGQLQLSDEEKAYDLYDKAMESDNIVQAKYYLRQALKLKPDYLDAKVELATYLDDYSKSINELTKLKTEEEKRLENEGYFKDDKIGDFYGILETRPYMRLLYQLGRTYQEVTSYRKAASIYKRMIELNENDNLGARYSLMGIYAILEEKEAMEQLLEKYPEESIPVYLFSFVLNYKLYQYEEARKYLKKIQKRVPKFKKLLLGTIKFDDLDEEIMPGYYKPYSFQEVMIYLTEFKEIFTNEIIADFMIKTFK